MTPNELKMVEKSLNSFISGCTTIFALNTSVTELESNMSKVTKRKHVMKEMDTDFFEPPTSNQLIVRILGSRGNNLHEVESAEPIQVAQNTDEETETSDPNAVNKFLVSMPTKFRKNVWVKRGDYVIVEPIEEGDKVKAAIVRILTPQQIKQFTKDGIWPEKFAVKDSDESNKNENSSLDDDSDDDELFRNPNRVHQTAESSDDDSDDESSDSDNDD